MTLFSADGWEMMIHQVNGFRRDALTSMCVMSRPDRSWHNHSAHWPSHPSERIKSEPFRNRSAHVRASLYVSARHRSPIHGGCPSPSATAGCYPAAAATAAGRERDLSNQCPESARVLPAAREAHQPRRRRLLVLCAAVRNNEKIVKIGVQSLRFAYLTLQMLTS